MAASTVGGLQTCLPTADTPTLIHRDRFDTLDGWTQENGVWVRENGRLLQTETAAPVTGYLLSRDAGAADVDMQITLTTPPEGFFICGLHVRMRDATHFLEAELNNSPAYNGWAGIGIWLYDGTGVFTQVAVHRFSPQNATTYTLGLRAIGALISAECDGITLTGTCTEYRDATRFGVFEARDRLRLLPTLYDNFVIRTT